MDMEDVPPHSQSRKRWRIDCSSNGTGSNDAKVLVPKKMEEQQLHGYHDEDEDGDGDGSNDKDRLLAWHSSRIFRVSRASGGKDRHSKVLTAKGLRDRRVRLSVSTAIQFYDLQNRLGYDQPSKAVEWLIKKAADAIAELPSLNSTAFPPTPKQASDEKRPEPEPTETDQVHPFTFHNHQQQQQLIHLSGSACSSTSETSKGSVLSLSRSEIRVKARERARERAAKEREKDKEKEKENDSHVFHNQHHQSPTPNPSSNPQTSFTDLLTVNASNTASLDTATARHHPNADLFPKHFREMAAPMDYFGRQHQHQHQQAMVSHGVSRPQHYPLLLSSFGSPPPLNVLPLNISTTTSSAGDHAELQHFSFIQDHIIPEAQAPPNDYNLNFSISSSQQAGFNRGTLQSNTPSSMSHHHLPHKYPSPVDGPPSLPFFISPAAAENNQFPAGFDGRLQLYFGDTCRHSDLKGKSKWGP